MSRNMLDFGIRHGMGGGMRCTPLVRERARLFGSPFLEAFTVISVPAFIALWAVVLPALLVCALVVAPTLWAFPLVLLGVLGWSFTEYALHRYLFHFEARSELVKRWIFIIHGNHHADPNDPLRNLMPPVVSLPVGAMVWAGCVAAIGPAGTWALLGFMAHYVAYDLVHYACHQWPIENRFARMFKVHHMRHHHRPLHGNYAITGMLWDRLLATRIGSIRDRA
jgi:sterol desaturase/sphingolipid hydroxylase (fatty acid hydroxylase superfamily)